MYDKSDPRSQVAVGVSRAFTSYAPASYARFNELSPVETTEHARTWFARGQNAIIAYSEVTPGARFVRRGQIDEWALVLPEQATSVTIETAGERAPVRGHSLSFLPPGDSDVTFHSAGCCVRLFTTRSNDLAALCSNAAAYVRTDDNIPPFVAWPTPPDGFRIRSYDLDVAARPDRFGCIWRCSTFMVNKLPTSGPRDISKLSPHHHEDFEQYSLALRGAYVHHLRWPWTPDLRMWRSDEHESCAAPSLAVIPPPAIHTSRAVAPGLNELFDIFSPPRLDFSRQPGWVLNANDYPLPPGEALG